MHNAAKCPVCSEVMDKPPETNGDSSTLSCANCGKYRLPGIFEIELRHPPNYSAKQRAILSHCIRKAQRPGETPFVASYWAEEVLSKVQLPSALEQLDLMLMYIAGTIEEPGATLELNANHCKAIVGAMNLEGAKWVLNTLRDQGFVAGFPDENISRFYQLSDATLTASGWSRLDEIAKQGAFSRKGFMAMKFGDAEMDSVFLNYLKPAASQAGFELLKLDERPKAGLIDDQIRLNIRNSRFLVADLSHANPGAYWEAGYAEGLGRPVIYTCKKSVFDDPAAKPHFDTNHHTTVIWDPLKLEEAAKQLKTIIRVTLPDEAILVDPD
jgi:hypothetical protein